jgi:NAD+ diphosphatase
MTSPNMSSPKIFIPGIVPPTGYMGPSWWFAFQGNNLLVYLEDSSVRIPCEEDFSRLGITIIRQHYLGLLEGRPCYSVELTEDTKLPEGMAFQGLRQLFNRLEEDLFWIAGRAVQIVDWDRTHQFCGKCGSRMITRSRERAKECPQCGLVNYPRLSPAIIVLVERDSQILLARSHRFPPGMYSVIAGFVDPGETLEEAVVREVKEETGIDVKDIQYFGSQPWPFPHSLMIAFTAVYAGGEIVIEDEEIEAAGWFTADNLPALPNKISIARKLIDWFLAKQGKAT